MKNIRTITTRSRSRSRITFRSRSYVAQPIDTETSFMTITTSYLQSVCYDLLPAAHSAPASHSRSHAAGDEAEDAGDGAVHRLVAAQRDQRHDDAHQHGEYLQRRHQHPGHQEDAALLVTGHGETMTKSNAITSDRQCQHLGCARLMSHAAVDSNYSRRAVALHSI